MSSTDRENASEAKAGDDVEKKWVMMKKNLY